uniref:Zinc finger protein 234 n=1 Tax=Cacopsylla melanoneura TaxID=428564 RepID=A0A8D8Q6F8_9HEMI
MGNWKQWCRLCGESEDIYASLDNTDADGQTIFDAVMKSIAVQLDEDKEMPQNICKACDRQLLSINRFVQKCVKVQKMFKELVDANSNNVDIIRQSYIKENQYTSDNDNYEEDNDEEDEWEREPLSDREKTDNKEQEEEGKKKTARRKTSKAIPKLRLKSVPKSKGKSKKEPKKRVAAKARTKSKPAKKKVKKQEEEIDTEGDDGLSDSALPPDSPNYFDDPDFDIKPLTSKQIKIKSEIKKENGDVARKMRRKLGDQMPPLGKYDCHSCDISFRTWTQLSHHCTAEHKSAAYIMCPGCGIKLTSRVMVSRHRAIHSGIPVETFTCDKCGKNFLRKSLLQDHILSHIPKEEQPFVCCKCARRFHSEALLRHHERVHLPPEDRATYPCLSCDKRFSSRSAVTAHTKAVHLGERPFVCHECGQSFASKGILQEHLTIHSDDAPWKCDICNKKFKTKYRLKLHLDTHGETPYACPHCPMKLNTRRTLRMHLVVHRDTKAYQCVTCGKSFRRSKDLKNHHNLHTGKRPYTCPWCSRTFANGSNCRSHKRRMHPEELKLYESSLGIVHKEKKKFDVSLHLPPQPPEDPNVEPRASSANGNHSLDPNNDTTGTTIGSERGTEEEVEPKVHHQEEKLNAQLLKLTQRMYSSHQLPHGPGPAHHQLTTTAQQNYAYQQFNFVPNESPGHFYDQQHSNEQQSADFPATIPAFPGNPYIHNLMYNRGNTHNM